MEAEREGGDRAGSAETGDSHADDVTEDLVARTLEASFHRRHGWQMLAFAAVSASVALVALGTPSARDGSLVLLAHVGAAAAGTAGAWVYGRAAVGLMRRRPGLTFRTRTQMWYPLSIADPPPLLSPSACLFALPFLVGFAMAATAMSLQGGAPEDDATTAMLFLSPFTGAAAALLADLLLWQRRQPDGSRARFSLTLLERGYGWTWWGGWRRLPARRAAGSAWAHADAKVPSSSHEARPYSRELVEAACVAVELQLSTERRKHLLALLLSLLGAVYVATHGEWGALAGVGGAQLFLALPVSLLAARWSIRRLFRAVSTDPAGVAMVLPQTFLGPILTTRHMVMGIGSSLAYVGAAACLLWALPDPTLRTVPPSLRLALPGLIAAWSFVWWLPRVAEGAIWVWRGRRRIREELGLDVRELMQSRGCRWRWDRGWIGPRRAKAGRQ